MIHCEVVSSEFVIEDEAVEVFGLSFFNANETTPFKTVENIFTSKDEAIKLKALINESDISQVNIDDIIEDWLV